ncbi:hypothetical protein LL972_06915, partial [Xanthomonas campestris pv. asclepiadis]|uniref:hypothetical protein n=1 Tax=Xanthomonas campestris TaxID=339 RepID=UPI001E648BCA
SHARVGHRQGLYPKPSIQQDGGFLFARYLGAIGQSRQQKPTSHKPQANVMMMAHVGRGSRQAVPVAG